MITSAQKKSLRVFVVEDHPDTLKSLIMILSQMGYAVNSASSVKAALEALPDANCDVLISDLGLPDGDGWELLQKCRPRLPKRIFAIAMSGYNSSQDVAKSVAAGFHCHIAKPFKASSLENALRTAESELNPAKT